MSVTNPKMVIPDRVLVIDDSDIARAAIVGILTDGNFVVFEQPSAIGATRAIREHAIRAVVVDISMPGLSGDKLLGVLRKNQRLDGLVIVIVSARSSSELATMNELRDADAVMPKADLATDLVRTLTRLLRGSRFRPSENFATSGDR